MNSPKLITLAAASLILTTTSAVAATAAPSAAPAISKLSVANAGLKAGDRVGPRTRGESRLTGGNNGLGIVMLGIVLAGAAYAAYELIDGENNDRPASP